MGDIWPVILSGGSGERLWPLSRKLYPKQFQALTSDASLFQECAQRVGPDFGYRPPIVICNDDHRFIVAEQLRLVGIQPETILLEPVSRNTAPAIAAGAFRIGQTDPDAIMAVFPSDHMIPDGPALPRQNRSNFRRRLAAFNHGAPACVGTLEAARCRIWLRSCRLIALSFDARGGDGVIWA